MKWLIDFIVERPAMAARYFMWIMCVISGIIGYIATKNNKQKVVKSERQQITFTLENQEGKIENIDEVDIRRYLTKMFDDPNQFVILVPSQLQHQIRFIQARMMGEKVEVQIAIQKKDVCLYHKYTTRGECLGIFHDFYNHEFILNMDEYTQLKWMEN